VFAVAGAAQEAESAADTQEAGAPLDTFFKHSDKTKWWISGQANFIAQAHGTFYSAYSGTNSFTAPTEHAVSRVMTLYTAYEFTPHSAIYFDLEETGGGGLSNALGIAGFVNLDVVRNPSLGQAPYMARLIFEQIIPFSHEEVESERTPLAIHTKLPAKGLTIRFGKFSMADFFDNNVGGTDSHYQFLNWTADNNGAWDYAADTRGYTFGLMFDYEDRNWGIRFAEALVPKVANGQNLDADLARLVALKHPCRRRRCLPDLLFKFL